MKFRFAQAALLAIATTAGAQIASAQVMRGYPVGSQLQEDSKIRGVVITSYRGNVGSMIVGHQGHDYEVFARDRNVRNAEPMLRIVKMTSDRGAVPIGPGKLFNDVVKTTARIIESGAYDNSGGHSFGPMLKSLRGYGAPVVYNEMRTSQTKDKRVHERNRDTQWSRGIVVYRY